MYINIIPTAPWRRNEEQQPLHIYRCVNWVAGLSKPEQRTCAAQGIEVEGTFRDGLKHAAAKPPLLNI